MATTDSGAPPVRRASPEPTSYARLGPAFTLRPHGTPALALTPNAGSQRHSPSLAPSPARSFVPHRHVVDQILDQLYPLPASEAATLRSASEKLQRLRDLHTDCRLHERQLHATHLALLSEHAVFAEKLLQVRRYCAARLNDADTPAADRHFLASMLQLAANVDAGGELVPSPARVHLQSMLADFNRDGFVVLDRVVPPTLLEALLAELNAIKAAAEAEASSSAESGGWDAKSSGAAQDACTFAFARDKDGALSQPVRLHKAQGVALRSERVQELLRLPELVKTAADLVHSGIALGVDAPPERREVDVFGTKFFPVEAGSVGSVSWHDDNYYFGTERSHTVSCAVYLRDIDARSACLRVVPGSHRDATVGSSRAHLYTPSPQQHGEYIDESIIATGELARDASGAARAAVDVPVAAGTAVLFDANLLHAVHPNSVVGGPPSERVAFHYIPGDLDTGFRGTSFARGRFADRHRVC